MAETITQTRTVRTISAAGQAVPQKLKVAAYCRVSTLLDSQEGSIDVQRDHYKEQISANPDWELAGIYLEAGVSATKAETRPQLQRLITDCKKGKIDLVLTKSISRFSRNTIDCIEMVRVLTSLGVNLYFEKEHIHTGTMESELMLSLLACFAEDESRSISGNVKWAINKRFRDGTYRGSRAPYGYVWEDGKLVILPEQAEVVKKIYRMALSGHGCKSIAQMLNREGVPSPLSKPWRQATVARIIQNPAYRGDMLYQKTYMDESFRQRTNLGEKDQYYEEGHHEAIVSHEDFEKAEAIVAQRAKECGYREGLDTNRSGNRYSFSGNLRCALCGEPLTRMKWSGERISWICRKHKEKRCNMPPQDEADLKRAFINCLNKLAWSQGRRSQEERILDVYEEMLAQQERNGNAGRLAEIEKAIETARKELKKANAAIIGGHNPVENMAKKVVLNGEIDRLEAEKVRLSETHVSGDLQALQKFISRWTATDDAGAFPDDAFPLLIESCTVDSRKEAIFHFKCGLSLAESLVRVETQPPAGAEERSAQ